MFALQKSKNRTSSRHQIALKGVRDNILILPNNKYRAIIKVSSLNFELKSEEEQDAIIDTYESFLNSVDTSLQIIVRTRQIDMDKYLEDIVRKTQDEPEEIYRDQLNSYDGFIRSLITTNTILTRYFYVVVPVGFMKKTDHELVKEQINIKTDIVAKGMARLGMHTTRLSSLEILDLFYGFYSPGKSKMQPLTEGMLKETHEILGVGDTKGGKND